MTGKLRIITVSAPFAGLVALLLVALPRSGYPQEIPPSLPEMMAAGRMEPCTAGRGPNKPLPALDRILKEHALWLNSKEKQGKKLDVPGERLNDLWLEDKVLARADLDGANFTNSNLTGADLHEANLVMAHLNANFTGASLRKARLDGADLQNACLEGADLAGASLGCDISLVTTCAQLSFADLTGAELRDAEMAYADLSRAIYEPKSNPRIRSLATARNLELLTYRSDPSALTELRKEFQDGGFRSQERKITYALKRREAERGGYIERCFNVVAFDWTSKYGMSPGRPLQILVGIFVISWTGYVVFIHLGGVSGIYRTEKGPGQEQGETTWEQIRPQRIPPGTWWHYLVALVKREARVFFWAGFFSLTSAFNIGFQNLDFGKWLRLLPRVEYDLQARGWVRTMAGLQSLISVYMLALWVLTYFGRPFQG